MPIQTAAGAVGGAVQVLERTDQGERHFTEEAKLKTA